MNGISKWTLVFIFGVAFLLACTEYDAYRLLSKKMTEAAHTFSILNSPYSDNFDPNSRAEMDELIKREIEFMEGEIDKEETDTDSSFDEELSQSAEVPLHEEKSKKSTPASVPMFERVVKSLQSSSDSLALSPSMENEKDNSVPTTSSDSSILEEKAYIDESDDEGDKSKSEDIDDSSDNQDDDVDKNDAEDGESDTEDEVNEESDENSSDETVVTNETTSLVTNTNTNSSFPPFMSRQIRRRSRYGKRLGHDAQLSPLMIELSRPNNTYYPPDHLNDAIVSHLMKQIANKERKLLNRLPSPVRARGKEYALMLRAIDIPSKRGQPPKSLQLEFHSKYHQGPGEICEGCRVDKTFPLRLTSKNKDFLLLRKFVGNVETKDIELTGRRIPQEGTPIDVTAIMVTTKTRLFFIKQLLYRWDGPMIIVVNGHSHEERAISEYIRNTYLPSRLTIIMYLMGPKNPSAKQFPVNLLRNLAIRNVETSHYLIMDMDLWPTRNAYHELIHLPSSILQANKAAVILPAFFYNKRLVLPKCSSFKHCAFLGLHIMPENKTELEACLLARGCQSRKPGIRTHLYVMPSWFVFADSIHVVKLKCMVADFQEPYVMLRNSDSTPLFEEKFVNYGYNKVQLIEHLRAAGYSFYILTQAFAMDVPHEDSDFRKAYLSRLHERELPMRDVYAKFQAELNTKYRNVKRFPVCPRSQSSFYTIDI